MKPRNLSLATRLLIRPIGALLLAHSANADTLYWDRTAGGAINDGAGAWLGTGLWNNGSPSANWTSGDNAIFGNSGSGGAVTLASPGTTVGSLTFNYFTGTYTLGTVNSEITLNNGITKNAGAGIVTFQGASNIKLGAAQTFTNNSATNLTIGALNLNGNVLTIGGTGTTTFDGNAANVLSGAGGIIKNGSGNFNFDGGTSITHTFTGDITVNGGSIGFQNSGVLTGRNVNLTNGYLGGRSGSSFTWSSGLGTGNDQIQITGGTSGLSGEGGTGSTFTIGSSGSTLKWGATGENSATGFFNPTVFLANGDARMNANGKGTLANGLDLNGTTRTITSLQTTDGVATSGFTISSAIVNTAGSAAGLTKTGVGNLILTAANTYNGATTITSGGLNTTNGGGAITLSGSGTINYTTALNLNGTGTLRLVNTEQVDRFADGAAITANGGTISYENTSGAVNYTEALGGSGSAVTLSSGNLDVVLNTNQASTGSQTLTFGTGGTTNMVQSGTATVTFSAATTGPQATGNKNMIAVIGAGSTSGWVNAAASNPIIGPWATTGTAAAAQTDYAVYSGDYVVPAATAASAESNWTSATTQYTAELLGTASTTLGATRTMAALKLTATTSALTSVTFAGAAATDFITVTGSSLANGDIVSFGGTAPGGLSTGIPYYVVNSGTNGAGTFTVSATSGGAPIDLTSAGTGPNVIAGITLGSGINLGTTGILNATGAGLTIGKGTGGVVTLPSTTSGNLYMNAGNGASIIVGAPIADNGAGVLTLVKSGSSTLRLFDVNTYTGNTIINAGTLQIGLNGTANGAKLGGSGGNYAGNIFIAAGASLNYQSDANQTFSGVISGDGTLTKAYTGTLTLSDANTYTGKTFIAGITTAGAGILSVSSFNSVNGGTPLLASSSLGAPTTIAGGTIELGGGAQSTDTLKYTGGGETTDRIINFNFNASSTRVIDASGTGLLKFTSNFTSNGTATSSVTLQGSGSGQLDGGLPFAFSTLTKTGASVWTIGGPVGATGGVTLNGGSTGSRLNINHSQALGTGTFTISSGNNATIGNTSGADILITTNNAQAWQNNFAVVATNSLNMGTGNITLGGTRQITVTGAGTFTVGGVISGASLGITKLGAGTMVLSGANTYTGNTTVSAGTLAVTGSLGATAVSVTGTATLGGNGNIGGSVTIGATAHHALAVAATPGAQVPRAITGTLTLTSGNILDLTAAVPPAAGEYVLATATTAITGTPTTINYNGVTGTVSVDTVSNPKRLLLTATGGPGPVDHFDISAIGSPQTVGTPITGITLTAKDALNNTATSFTGVTATVTFGGGGGFSGTSGGFTAGVLTGVSVTPTVSGSNRTLTVSDGASPTPHTGSTNITTIRSLYAAWAAGYLPGADVSDPAGNYDGDDLTNFQEFAFGTNPTVSTGGSIVWVDGGAVTNPGLPVAFNFANPGVDYRAVFGRRKDYVAAGLTYTVEFSAGLDVWVPSGVTPTVLTGAGGLNPSEIEAVSVPYPLLIDVGGNNFKKPTFLRVKVSN